MSFLKIVVALFFATTAAVAADGPEVRMAEIPPGTFVIYDRDGSDPFTVIYGGRVGDDYIVEIRDGPTPTGALSHTYRMDEHGQRRFLKTNDNEYTYRPHFCTRTLGSCRFKAHNQKTGQHFSMQRILRNEGDKFSYKLYLDGRNVEEGWFRSGRFGIPVAYTGSNGQRGWIGTLREIVTPE